MRRIALAILTLFVYTQVTAQQQPAINWITFEQLSDSLNTKPKKVLLFFHTDWCAYCRKMQNEVFLNPGVIKTINENYYAVSFDAESTKSFYFDGRLIENQTKNKVRGSYHDITKLLAHKKNQFVFPTTILLNADFTIRKRYFTYMGPKKIIEALTR